MPKASSKKADKIVDVAKPGSLAPDASSRPVIVGHRAILQDPMVKPTEEKSEDAERITVVSTTAPTLTPLSDADTGTDKPKKPAKEKESSPAEKPAEKAPAKDDSTPEEGQAYVIEPVKPKAEAPKATESEPEVKDEPAEAPKEAVEDKAEPAAAEDKPAGSDDEAATEAVAEQAAAKKTTEKEDKEAAARAEVTQKLVADKTYYVPIGQAKRRRRLSLALLLIVLLLAVLVYLAIDADIIKTSINLPVQFFH